MGRYPAEPLEDKLAWMRAKQQRKCAPQAAPRGPSAVPAPPREAARPEPPQMLRINQVAQLLGVSRRTVYRWFGKRCVVIQGPVRRVVLIPQRVLDEWVRKHTVS